MCRIPIPTMITGEIGLDAWEYVSFLFNKGDNRDRSLLNACSDIFAVPSDVDPFPPQDLYPT